MKFAKAAVFKGVRQPFEVRDYPIVPAPAGMAGISLKASGICGTDIHIHRGKISLAPPKIIGHEFVGSIEDISDADSASSGLKTGDNVIVDIACPCGKCSLCLSGDDANCLNLGVTNENDPEISPHLWGGYAEYNFSPVKNLIKIPSSIKPKTAAVYACAGPTTIHAFSLMKKANIDPEAVKTAVIQGFGPVGSFSAAYLSSLGVPNIIVITGRENQHRENMALKLGVTKVFSLEKAGEKAISEYVSDLTGGVGADLVFEASGSINALPFGLQLLRNRGCYLVPGQYSDSGKAAISPELITFKALQIIGSSQYSLSDVYYYLSFMESSPGLHPLIASLASEYKVADINRAFSDAESGANIKTLLVK